MKNSILKQAVRLITNNFGLKILAVIVSCGLWFVVNTINDPLETDRYYNIPVEMINTNLLTNENKVYDVLDGTDTVNVSVTGRSSVLSYISREDIKAVADMAELTFMNTVRIQVSSARSNSELDFKTNIDSVKLSIETVARDQKPINVSTTGELAAGYVVGGVKPSQNVVRLSGPESLIQQIDHVEAVVDVEGAASDIDTSAELKLYDAKNNEIKNSSIKMNITTVNVSVTIYATKVVPLSFVISDEPQAGYVVSSDVFSLPDTVTIAGRSNVLEGISRISVADPALSVEGLTESMTVIVNVKKYLPSGVQFADSNFGGNVSVTVGIEPLVTKELQIPARKFAAGNKPENFDLTLREVEGQNYYTIRISGTKAAVDAVNADSIIGVVDMDALLEKLGLTEWVPGVYQGEIIFNLPENVSLEQPYLMTVVLEAIEEEEENNNE